VEQGIKIKFSLVGAILEFKKFNLKREYGEKP
jgi:hypothetical protein